MTNVRRGRLQQASGHRVAGVHDALVQQRGQPAHHQQRDEEQRHLHQRGWMVQQVLEVKAHAHRDEEDRDQEPEADPFQLGQELLIRLAAGDLDQPHQQARRERAENRREAEPVRQHPAAQRKREGGAHAELAAPFL